MIFRVILALAGGVAATLAYSPFNYYFDTGSVLVGIFGLFLFILIGLLLGYWIPSLFGFSSEIGVGLSFIIMAIASLLAVSFFFGPSLLKQNKSSGSADYVAKISDTQKKIADFVSGHARCIFAFSQECPNAEICYPVDIKFKLYPTDEWTQADNLCVSEADKGNIDSLKETYAQSIKSMPL